MICVFWFLFLIILFLFCFYCFCFVFIVFVLWLCHSCFCQFALIEGNRIINKNIPHHTIRIWYIKPNVRFELGKMWNLSGDICMRRINKRVTNCHMITLMNIPHLSLEYAQTFNLSSHFYHWLYIYLVLTY